jgi:uncharacterized protein
MDVTPAEPRARLVEVDVVRAIALIGVCVMNYHGYLIFEGSSAYPPRNFAERVFDPWEGPLSTRFAATFVTLAGIGITLLTRRTVAGGDRTAISALRWTLVRRGVLLYLFGYFLNWVWNGTIIVFYGAFFVVGAALFTLRGALARGHRHVGCSGRGGHSLVGGRPCGRGVRHVVAAVRLGRRHPITA